MRPLRRLTLETSLLAACGVVIGVGTLGALVWWSAASVAVEQIAAGTLGILVGVAIVERSAKARRWRHAATADGGIRVESAHHTACRVLAQMMGVAALMAAIALAQATHGALSGGIVATIGTGIGLAWRAARMRAFERQHGLVLLTTREQRNRGWFPYFRETVYLTQPAPASDHLTTQLPELGL